MNKAVKLLRTHKTSPKPDKTNHGTYAVRFPQTLLQAGDLQGETLYRWFRREIAATFETGGPDDERQAHRFVQRRIAGCPVPTGSREKPALPGRTNAP
jgi:hypothetical protein